MAKLRISYSRSNSYEKNSVKTGPSVTKWQQQRAVMDCDLSQWGGSKEKLGLYTDVDS
jgi:hypothetical protein